MGPTAAAMATGPGPAQQTESRHVSLGSREGLVSDHEPQRWEHEAMGDTDPFPGTVSTAAQSWPPGRAQRLEVRVGCGGRALCASGDG